MDITTILVSVVTYGIVEIFKKIDSVPLHEGQKGKLRIVASVLSLVGAGLMSASDSTFSSFGTPELANTLAQGFVAFLLTIGGHKVRNWLA